MRSSVACCENAVYAPALHNPTRASGSTHACDYTVCAPAGAAFGTAAEALRLR